MGSCMAGATMSCTSGSCNGAACLTCPTSSPPTGILGGNKTICPGGSTTLALSGGSLGSGASWVWYSGPNHTGAFGQGQTMVMVSPPSTTTYAVRAEGPGQCAPSADQTTKVTISSRSVTVSPTMKKAPCNDGQDRGVFTASVAADTMWQSVVWWVSYINSANTTPMQVTPGGRILVISNNGLTLTAVPQDSIELWVEITDNCSGLGSITSNHVRYLVPTYDPDTGACTPP